MKAGHFGGDFKTVLAAIAVGAVFLTVIAVVMGCAAAKTGMTFGQLINYAYGKHGVLKSSAFCWHFRRGFRRDRRQGPGRHVRSDGL